MNKSKLLDLLAAGRADMDAWMTAVTPEQKVEAGTQEHWSAADFLGHLTSWCDRDILWVHAAVSGQPLPAYHDLTKENAGIWQENRGLDWSQATSRFEQVRARYLARLESMSEEEVVRAISGQASTARPIWRTLVGLGYGHWETHLAEWYIEHGQAEKGFETLERSVAAMRQLDPSPEWQGLVSYNAACFYALRQNPEPAFALLPRAFEARPDLIELARTDTDLNSLRGDARFEALVPPK